MPAERRPVNYREHLAVHCRSTGPLVTPVPCWIDGPVYGSWFGPVQNMYMICNNARPTAVQRFSARSINRFSRQKIQYPAAAIGSKPSSTAGWYGRRRLIIKMAPAVIRPRTPVMIHSPITSERPRSVWPLVAM